MCGPEATPSPAQRWRRAYCAVLAAALGGCGGRIAEEDVRGLDVAMDDAAPTSVDEFFAPCDADRSNTCAPPFFCFRFYAAGGAPWADRCTVWWDSPLCAIGRWVPVYGDVAAPDVCGPP